MRNEIFKNTIASNNAVNSKARDVAVIALFNIRRLNRLIDIEFSLNDFDRKTDTATFANINKISIKKELNVIEAKEFETYANNCNSENSLIAFLISQNRSFAVIMLVRNAIVKMNYARKTNVENVAIFEESNVDVFTAAFKSIINESFNIFSSSTSLFSYMKYT